MASRRLVASLGVLLLPLLLLSSLVAAVAATKGGVEVVADDDWRKILEGEWMVEFYAPWCPACQQLQPEWVKLAAWSKDLNIRVGKVDITLQTGLSGRFLITSLPTIYHIHEGVFRQYEGSRLEKDFLSFIEDKKWLGVKPVSSWVDPNSLAMSGMSALMDFSHWIKNTHAYFTEQLGIPVWVSYLLFSLATILMGLLLGAVFVLVIDRVCPPKRHPSAKAKRVEVLSGGHAPAPARGNVGQAQARPEAGTSAEETELVGKISDALFTDGSELRQRQVHPTEED
ncbi:thioredoxin-related transmembrane protein 1-like [Lampetra fluviatilis]